MEIIRTFKPSVAFFYFLSSLSLIARCNAQSIYAGTVSATLQTAVATFYGGANTISVYNGRGDFYVLGSVPACQVDSNYNNGNGQCNNFYTNAGTICVSFATAAFPNTGYAYSASTSQLGSATATITAIQSVSAFVSGRITATILGNATIWGNDVYVTKISSCNSGPVMTMWTTPYPIPITSSTDAPSSTDTSTVTDSGNSANGSTNANANVSIIAGLVGAGGFLLVSASVFSVWYIRRRHLRALADLKTGPSNEFSSRGYDTMVSKTLFSQIKNVNQTLMPTNPSATDVTFGKDTTAISMGAVEPSLSPTPQVQ